MEHLASAAKKDLRRRLNPLDATLTKNRADVRQAKVLLSAPLPRQAKEALEKLVLAMARSPIRSAEVLK